MPTAYSKYNIDEDTDDIDLGLPKATHKVAVSTPSAQMNDMPIRGEESQGGRCKEGLCGCIESCSNFWCCFLKGGRVRACGFCSMCLLLTSFFIAILVLIVSRNPHKTKELFYTTGHSSWDEFYNLKNAISGHGANVCDIKPTPRLYPSCDYSVTVYGRSGIPYLRAIAEEGTRISTMDRYCLDSYKPLGDYILGCFDESWFHHSSLASYDYNLERPHQVFNTSKTIFLIRDPFDGVIDLYYRRHWARRPLNLFKSDPMSTFSNHQDVMTFAITEFKQWNDFMEQLKVFTKNNDDFLYIWYDDLDSDVLWRNTTSRLFEYIRDPEYYPTLEQSLRCIDESKLEDGPSYVKGLPAREKVFTASDRKTLCSMIGENWVHQRWGDFCVSV